MLALASMMLVGILFICVIAIVGLPGGKWLGLKIANHLLIAEFVRLQQHEFGIEKRIQARQEYFILQERILVVIRLALASLIGCLLALELVFGLWLGRDRLPWMAYALLHCAFYASVAGFLCSAVAYWVVRFQLEYFLEFSVTGKLEPPDGLKASAIRIRKSSEQHRKWWTRG